jgi:type I restriction enzyme, S subunit
MQTYEKMKDSGVAWLGKIPSGWAQKHTKYLFQEVKESVGEEPSKYELLSLTLRGIIPRSEVEGGKNPENYNTYQIVKSGDLIVCLFDYDVTPRTVGRTTKTGMVTGAYTNLRPYPGVSTRYYNYLFLSLDTTKELLHLCTGLRNGLSKPTFFGLNLPVPNFEAQEKIADFLDKETAKIDHLIAKQEKLLELLEEKRRATITHAVTRSLDPSVGLKETNIPWLGQIPSHWDVKRVKDVAFVVLGKMVQNEQKKPEEIHKPYLKSRNIQWNGIDLKSVDEMWFKPRELEDYRLKEGDIVVSEGGDVGKCIMWQDSYGELYFQNSVNRVRVISSVVAKYVYYVFQHLALNEVFMNTVNKVSIAHLTKDKLVTYHIPMPSVEDQQIIADYLDAEDVKFRKLRKKIQAQIILLKERRTSLISHAVTGKVRV